MRLKPQIGCVFTQSRNAAVAFFDGPSGPDLAAFLGDLRVRRSLLHASGTTFRGGLLDHVALQFACLAACGRQEFHERRTTLHSAGSCAKVNVNFLVLLSFLIRKKRGVGENCLSVFISQHPPARL